jgi:hypothetical protein
MKPAPPGEGSHDEQLASALRTAVASVQSQGALWGAPCVVVFAPVSSVGMSHGRNWMCSHLITRIT